MIRKYYNFMTIIILEVSMNQVKRLYVEKKPDYAVKAKELAEELQSYLSIETIRNVRVLIRYDVENVSDATFE